MRTTSPTPAPSPAEHKEARRIAEIASHSMIDTERKLARALLDLRSKAEALIAARQRTMETVLAGKFASEEGDLATYAFEDAYRALRSCLSEKGGAM